MDAGKPQDSNANPEGAVRDASSLTHVDGRGHAQMVDVGGKAVTAREARAEARVTLQPATLSLIRDNRAAKGDVLAVARVAGILAAKRTDDLIPLCHSLGLSSVTVDFRLVEQPPEVRIVTTVRTEGKTGVEMEALTAAAVAGLTIYDMCKAVDRDMTISGVRLTYKSGGRSGTYERQSD
jgi:cyclic pyranopterin phosphate synthase